MKIIYWTELFLPDISGVGVMGYNLLPRLQQLGYEFIIITSHGKFDLPDKDNYNGIPIYRFPFHTVLENKDIGQIKCIVENINKVKHDFNPNLIHINSSEPSLFFHRHSKSNKTPILVTVHLFITMVHGGDTLYSRILKKADWTTTVSKAMLEDVRYYFPEIIERSSLIKNAIKIPLLEPSEISFNPPILLFLGRTAKDKGADIVIKAFSKVIKLYNNAILIISGDGPELNNLKKLSLKFGLFNSIKFTGEIPHEEVPKLINSVSIVITPSISREPFCLVALQAAQMERPVIASNVGGLPEVVKHKSTGLLIEKDNYHELFEKIVYLLKNPNYARRLGKAARKRAISEFNFDNCVNEYDKIYRKLINKKD